MWLHCGYADLSWISVQSPTGSSTLHHITFAGKRLCVWAPHGGTVFKLRSNNCLICRFAEQGCLHLILRLRKPRDLFAFEVILFICVLKFRFSERSTPKYLAEKTLFKTWLCMVYGVYIGVLARVICNTWHLPGLNYMSHWASHCWSLSRSLWRVAESSGSHIVRYTAMSSAKRRTWDCTLSG